MAKGVTPSDPNWEPPDFPDPAPADVVVQVPASWLSMDPDAPPLDNEPFQTNLTPVDIPPYVEPKDTTPKVYFGRGTGKGPRDELLKLSLGKEIDLLANNNIFMSKRQVSDGKGLGAMKAYVVGADTLSPAREIAVRIKKVALAVPPTNRKASASYSYNKFEFGYGSATAAHENSVSIHFESTDWSAKAIINIENPTENLELDAKFVQEVKDACHSKKSPDAKTEDLLKVLQAYGHFVPLSIVLGGRMTLTEDKTLEDWSTFEDIQKDFQAAARARFKVKSVPVKASGGNETYVWTIAETKVQNQALRLVMELKGGNEALADNNPPTLNDSWLDTLGSYKEWRTIGFQESSLVPITQLLKDDALRAECEELLKQYFVANLRDKDTGYAGHASGKAFDESNLKYSDGNPLDRDLARNAKGLRKIVVTSQGHVDGLLLTYDIYGAGSGWSFPTREASGRFGIKREKQYESKQTTFDPDEFITCLEVWVDEKKMAARYVRWRLEPTRILDTRPITRKSFMGRISTRKKTNTTVSRRLVYELYAATLVISSTLLGSDISTLPFQRGKQRHGTICWRWSLIFFQKEILDLSLERFSDCCARRSPRMARLGGRKASSRPSGSRISVSWLSAQDRARTARAAPPFANGFAPPCTSPKRRDSSRTRTRQKGAPPPLSAAIIALKETIPNEHRRRRQARPACGRSQ